jgi:hypothetical protein
MWWLLFILAPTGEADKLYVCIDRDGKYEAIGGPYATFNDAKAGMAQLRLDHKEYR